MPPPSPDSIPSFWDGFNPSFFSDSIPRNTASGYNSFTYFAPVSDSNVSRSLNTINGVSNGSSNSSFPIVGNVTSGAVILGAVAADVVLSVP